MRQSVETMTIRPLRRGELDTVRAIFDGMSSHSRYLRFHTPVPRLTDKLLRWLVDVDHRDHLALVAEVPGGARPTPVGTARLVRIGATDAEVSVAVVDSWQRRGVATRLLRALVERVAGEDITGLHVDILPDNAGALALFRAFAESADALGVRTFLSLD